VLLHSGADPAADADLHRGTQYLAHTLGAAPTGHYFYGRYYACQWLSADPTAPRERRDALARELLDAQQRDGTWKEDSFSPVYSTASALIILQSRQKRLWIFGAPH
jgi:hypothetical protein